MANNDKTMMEKVLTGIATTICTEAIMGSFKLITSIGVSKIEVSDWDTAYDNINKLLYRISKKQYEQYRLPTTNKESYTLTDNISYIVRLDKENFIKVTTSVSDHKAFISEKHLTLIFMGKKKYIWRARFLKESLNLTDKDRILVQHMNELKCDVIPHSFDTIVLSPTIKGNIINGLANWYNSKEWYQRHQMIHKIGVFLYGKPGTGKSTIVKAIATMFDNAPILTIDPSNVIDSIKNIIRTRRRYNRTICVLMEDFDMFFSKRSEESSDNEESNKKKSEELNQNAIFQLLDGIYSTDDTIYIATTNYKNKVDEALIRYGRFDIQEELDYFDRDQALECVKLLDYDEKCLDSLDIKYPVQPAHLQSKIMEYRANQLKKGK